MLLNIHEATALIAGATQSKVTAVLRVLRDHGLEPIKVRAEGRGGQYRITISQVVAVLLFHTLHRLRINDDCRYALLLAIARTPDEQLEAMADADRCYVAKIGRGIIPALWSEETLAKFMEEQGEQVAQSGLKIEPMSVKPFIEQVFQAARSVVASTTSEGAKNADA